MEEASVLGELYFSSIHNNTAGIEWKRKIFNEIKGLIKEGVPVPLIEQSIKTNATNYKSIIFKRLSKDNLILEDVFYFHPHLQVAPPAPVIYQNPDGTFSESYSNEEFHLRNKVYFTMNNALDYFYCRFQKYHKNEKKDLGAIKHVFSRFISRADLESKLYRMTIDPLDVLLFTIDGARALSEDKDREIYNILELERYIEEGLYILREKIHFSKMNDLTHAQ